MYKHALPPANRPQTTQKCHSKLCGHYHQDTCHYCSKCQTLFPQVSICSSAEDQRLEINLVRLPIMLQINIVWSLKNRGANSSGRLRAKGHDSDGELRQRPYLTPVLSVAKTRMPTFLFCRKGSQSTRKIYIQQGRLTVLFQSLSKLRSILIGALCASANSTWYKKGQAQTQ